MRRARHFTAFVLACEVRIARLESGTIRQRFGLERGPRAKLAFTRTGRKIGIRFGIGNRRYRAFDAYLHLIAQGFPVEQQGRLPVRGKRTTFAAVRIGVEHEAAFVVRLEQHLPGGKPAIGIGGGQGHRGRLGITGSARLLQQLAEGAQCFCAQSITVH